MQLKEITLFFFILCFSTSVFADKPPHEFWTFSFGFENDLFADTDRFYINGIQLNWISPELKWFEDLEWFKQDSFLSRQARNFISLLPYSDDPGRQRHLSFSIGQKIYTPQDIVSRNLVVNERPHAG